MPAQSQSQQAVFAMALAARRGEIKPEELQGAARKLFKDSSLSNDQLSDYAETKKSSLPKKANLRQQRLTTRGKN